MLWFLEFCEATATEAIRKFCFREKVELLFQFYSEFPLEKELRRIIAKEGGLATEPEFFTKVLNRISKRINSPRLEIPYLVAMSVLPNQQALPALLEFVQFDKFPVDRRDGSSKCFQEVWRQLNSTKSPERFILGFIRAY